jgi:hypothetical protein
MRCGDCKFWRALVEEGPFSEGAGTCHRSAPRPMAEAVAGLSGTLQSQGRLRDDDGAVLEVDGRWVARKAF